jgi:uncharacterized integral membrane protein
MALLRRRHAEPAAEPPAPEGTAQPTPVPPAQPTPPVPNAGATVPADDTSAPPPVGSQHVPRTCTGTAWVDLAAATLLAVALIVFLVQNTRSTEISFLWMTARTSLAVALLIAAVGAVLLTLTVGTARITQLRRQARRNRT